MASVKETVWKSLLNYPTIFPNALAVYNHLFCVIGNGYEWKDGELVDVCEHNENKNANTIKDAIINFINHSLIDEWSEDSTAFEILNNISGNKEVFNKYLINNHKNTIIYLEQLLDAENRINDFSIPVDAVIAQYRPEYKFSFYPLCNYSHILNIPDNIKPDWLLAVKQMINIMDEHRDLVDDRENKFEDAKKRIYELYNDRHNKCEYLGDIYEIIGMDTEECGAGCHSFDIDVYVCRRIKDGYTRTFEHVNRLV